jgi:hypothetical protein
VIVSPEIVPLPVIENGQLGSPDMDPFPLILIVTVLPSMWPVPVPVMLALPRHVPLNDPDTSVAVCVPIVQTKSLQEPTLVAAGEPTAAADFHVPSSDGTDEAG